MITCRAWHISTRSSALKPSAKPLPNSAACNHHKAVFHIHKYDANQNLKKPSLKDGRKFMSSSLNTAIHGVNQLRLDKPIAGVSACQWWKKIKQNKIKQRGGTAPNVFIRSWRTTFKMIHSIIEECRWCSGADLEDILDSRCRSHNRVSHITKVGSHHSTNNTELKYKLACLSTQVREEHLGLFEEIRTW